MNENYKKIFRNILFALLAVVLLTGGVYFHQDSYTNTAPHYSINNEQSYVYLSDLDFITENNWSYNGWSGHAIQKDKNQEGGTLGLIVDGEKRTYAKGISVHAKGQITYDISTISTDFPRFIAKIGVDASRGTNGSIWFQIYVSNDGTNWISLLKTGLLTGTSEAVDVDLNIEGYKYLRIYVDPSGSNAADHGTIANAKFVAQDYINTEVFYDKLHKLEYYDEILRQHDAEYNYEHNYRFILEREFVNKIGYWTIQNLVELDPTYIQTLDWILSDNENLEQIIEVGEVASGQTFINTIHTIYSTYKNEFKKENGYVYQKMMIGLAGAYGTDRVASPLTFSTRVGTYDVLERFTLVKQLFDNGAFLRMEEFKTYHVQLMRYVMQDAYRPEETLWLNALSKTKSNPLNHYAYLSYRLGPNYSRPEYHDLANKEKYDTKYMLSQYNVPYGDNITRYWMAMEFGGICWNISRTGQSVYRVNGIPSVGIYQPQHEAYLGYSQDANGIGVWNAYYNIFGWGKSCTNWYGGNPYRMLFNWGAKYFADKAITTNSAGNNAGYMLLGQAGLNQKEPFFKSLYLNLLANSYENQNEKISVYNKALESSKINLDSYDAIITLYKGMNKTSSEWHALAERIIDAYTYYPMAMYDLLKVIKPYLQGADRVDIDLREHDALVLASRATDAEVLQSSALKQIASVLLGKSNARLATFSFDGENAGKIVIDSSYANYDFNLYYSLDGGVTFSEKTTAHEIQLTTDEIARINVEDDIQIYMDGTSQVYTIDITKATLSSTLFANDLENRVIGVNLTYEWRNSENDPWTSYQIASPDNTGNKTLEVRVGYTGTCIPSDSAIFTFTEDNQEDTRKYVSISHLSIHAVSTEATSNSGNATFAIDGNYNTRYHSAWNGTDTERYITIQLDKPRYVSAVEFVPAAGGNGKIYDGTIWGSMDGENWEMLTRRTGITYTNQANTNEQAIENTKSFEIENPKQVQYIKIVADRTNGNWFTARHFNIFQDLTINPRPTAGIGYSTKEPTQDNVVARLVNVSTNNYEILSPGGDTHTFTENGEFTFRFKDTVTNVEGEATAKVDWIDREAPTATIVYSTTQLTNQSVVATLKPNEDVIVTNNGDFKVTEDGQITDEDGNILNGYTVDQEGNVKDADGNVITNINTFTYEFLSNGEFTFEFMDRAGNRGSATAKVDWIDHDIPEAVLMYDITSLTNKNVTVTVEFDKNVVVLNNGGKTTYTFTENGEFTFEFMDLAGNRSHITAKVDWMDKISPTAELKYDKTNSDKAIVSVINPSEEIIFQNGNGVYEFNQNGIYEILFTDKAGNVGKVVAVVDWLKENKPVSPNQPTNPGDNHSPITPNNPSNSQPVIPNQPNTGNNQSSDDSIDDSSNIVDTIPSDDVENPDDIEEEPDSSEDEKPIVAPDDKNNQEEIVEDKKHSYVIPVVVTAVAVLAIGSFILLKK